MNCLNSSHDFRLAKLDAQEDALVTGIAHDQESIIKKIHSDEVSRSRTRVGEIIAFVEKSLAEIDLAEENAY